MVELFLLFLKILIILLVAEGVVFGFALLIMLKCISISHKEDEERVHYEGNRLSEENQEH